MPGNWQARFWRPVERGDPSAEFNGRYGELAGLPVEAQPHMLRHACGCARADQGADTRWIQDDLGHRHMQHIVRDMATNPARFERL